MGPGFMGRRPCASPGHPGAGASAPTAPAPRLSPALRPRGPRLPRLKRLPGPAPRAPSIPPRVWAPALMWLGRGRARKRPGRGQASGHPCLSLPASQWSRGLHLNVVRRLPKGCCRFYQDVRCCSLDLSDSRLLTLQMTWRLTQQVSRVKRIDILRRQAIQGLGQLNSGRAATPSTYLG